ncbi:MAG: ribosome-associated translation inhibitor RaiA [Opitutaceae bacterium]|nr:ribosome-associated translation inhibitor RaiA [Opitutaceae bacterium]
MLPTIQIGFRNMEPSPAVSARIQDEFEKLGRYAGRMVSCRATIIAPHRHHRHGRHYQVHLDIRIPGRDIVVQHEPSARQVLRREGATKLTRQAEVDAPHRDPYVAIRDAFDAARRRLEDGVRRRREGPLRSRRRAPELPEA